LTPVQELNSAGIIWETGFSTKLKHEIIAVKGAIAVMEK
jgi:hypothetical protein